MQTHLRVLALGWLLLACPSPARAAEAPAAAVPAGLRFQAYVDLGTRYFRAGQFELAAAALEAALKKEQPPRLFFNLARAYHKSGRHAEALAQYERYLREEPNSPRRAEVESYCEALRGKPQPAPHIAASPTAAPSPAPPLYKRGWFWGVVAAGVVVVGASIAAGVVLGRRSDTPASASNALAYPLTITF